MGILIRREDDLSSRSIKSSAWAFILRGAEQIFSAARIVVLARLLSPKDFGTMGIALFTMSVLAIFTQTGFQQALIQKKDDITGYLDTAFTVTALRGILLYLILFFSAPYLALFFNSPESKNIIRFISLVLLLEGLSSIGVIYFHKNLEFNKEFVYRISGILADVIVSVSMAFILRNAWALAYGVLAGGCARLAASYMLHPYRPHLRLDVDAARGMFKFGRWILGSSFLSFIVTQGDDAFVGKVLGASALGFYQIAYRFSNLPVTEITHVVTQVIFPVCAKLQDAPRDIKNWFLKIFQYLSFLYMPIGAVIFIFAREITVIFLGEKWMSIIPILKIFTLYAVIRAAAASTGALFEGIGRPKINTKIQFVRLFILIVLIFPFTLEWGLIGAAWASVASIAFSFPLAMVNALREIRCGWGEFYKVILPSIANVSVVALIIFGYKRILAGSTEAAILCLSIPFCVVVYIAGIYLTDRIFKCGVLLYLRKTLRSVFV